MQRWFLWKSNSCSCVMKCSITTQRLNRAPKRHPVELVHKPAPTCTLLPSHCLLHYGHVAGIYHKTNMLKLLSKKKKKTDQLFAREQSRFSPSWIYTDSTRNDVTLQRSRIREVSLIGCYSVLDFCAQVTTNQRQCMSIWGATSLATSSECYVSSRERSKAA